MIYLVYWGVMRIIGLFVVVFGCFAVNRALGVSDMATIIGCVVGAGSYILINK